MKPIIQRVLFLALSAAALIAALAIPAPQVEPWNVLAEREGTYLQCTRPESPYGELLYFLVLDEPDSHGPFLGLYGPGTEGLEELNSGARLTVTTRGTAHDIWPIAYETVTWKQTGTAAGWHPPADVLDELADHGVYPVGSCGTYLEALPKSGGRPKSLVLLDSHAPGDILEIFLQDGENPLSGELDPGDRVALVSGPPAETGLPGAQVFWWRRIAPRDSWTPPQETLDALHHFELMLLE